MAADGARPVGPTADPKSDGLPPHGNASRRHRTLRQCAGLSMRQTARVFACHSFGALPLRCSAFFRKPLPRSGLGCAIDCGRHWRSEHQGLSDVPAGGGALLCSGLLGLSTIAAERQSPTSHRMVLTTSLWHTQSTQSTQSTPEHALDIAGEPQWSHACALCCRSAQWPCSPRACLPLLSFPLVCEACGAVLR